MGNNLNDDTQAESAGARKKGKSMVKKRGALGRWSKRIIISLGVLTIVYLIGPRITISEIERRSASGVPNELGELDDYLAESEAQYSDLVEGTEKLIHWQPGHEGRQTEFAVLYLHGFSGSHATLV